MPDATTENQAAPFQPRQFALRGSDRSRRFESARRRRNYARAGRTDAEDTLLRSATVHPPSFSGATTGEWFRAQDGTIMPYLGMTVKCTSGFATRTNITRPRPASFMSSIILPLAPAFVP